MSTDRHPSRRQVLEGLIAAGGTLAGLDAHAQASASAPAASAAPAPAPAPLDPKVAAALAEVSANEPGRPDDILIGQSTHFSGPVGPTSIKPARAVAWALDEFNRKGGVGGRNVRLIKLDDGYNPKRCVENVNKLIDEYKVVALHGLASTGNVGAVLPVLAEKKVPLICTYTGSPTVRAKHHPYHFTGTASYRDEVVQMVRNLVTTQRKDLGLIYQNSPFGQLMLPIVEEVCKEYGATLVVKTAVEVSGNGVEAQVAAMAAARPQAVLVISFGPSVVTSVRAVRNYIGIPVYVISVGMTGNVIGQLGDDSRGMAVTQVLPYPWRQTSLIIRDFTALMSAHGAEPDYEYLLGYLNVRVLLEGLKRVNPKKATSEAITRAMQNLGKIDMGGYPLNFGPNQHHGSKFVEITIVGPKQKFMR